MKAPKRRNWTANAAIMRKGGVHEISNKAKRQQDKPAFKRKIRAEQFGSFYLLNNRLLMFKAVRLITPDEPQNP